MDFYVQKIIISGCKSLSILSYACDTSLVLCVYSCTCCIEMPQGFDGARPGDATIYVGEGKGQLKLGATGKLTNIDILIFSRQVW